MSNNKTKQISIVMIITVVSKCLGFLRDIVLAYFYGSSPVSDAYFVSQTIPEFLFSLVVQAISIGFIPLYVEINEKRGRDKSNEFTNKILKICLLLSLLLIVVVNLFTREIVSVFASGFEGEKVALTIRFTRITVFAMLFRITVSVYTAYLHANGKFTIPAFNGVVLDIAVIASIIVASFTSSELLAWGMIAATSLQFILLFPSVAKTKPLMNFSLKNIIDDNVKQMLKLLLPVVLGVGANQINVLADRTMASSIPGAISSLNYANKVDNVLENIIILSLATVVFPLFAKNIAQDDKKAFNRNVFKSLDVVSFTMIPCSFVAFSFSEEIIRILFMRGAFDATALASSSVAMKFYSVGLVFLSYNAVLNRALYALKKVHIVSFVTCGSVAVNIIMNFILKPTMGIGGLALATSISNIFATILLSLFLKKSIGRYFSRVLPEILKAIGSSVLMILSMILFCKTISGFSQLVTFFIAALIGSAIFVVAELFLKSQVMTQIYSTAKSIVKRENY